MRLRRRTALAGSACALLLWAGGCARREPAPAFSYTLLDGRTEHTAQALRGKVVLVNFWATSCATCVQEMPALAATSQALHARGLRTLAVAMPYDAPARVAGFAERHALPFDVVIDLQGAIARAFGNVQATPTTFVISRRGEIVQRIVGAPDFAALRRQLEVLLGEPA
ncbi:MAG: TlpA family protein disulfide reductase [Rubrivivax sp.]|nr:TlpA family protein disulfide reductase [Rubrivivax sp.]